MTDDRLVDAGGLWWFLHDQSELTPLILDSLDSGEIGHRRPWEEDLELMGGAVPESSAAEEVLRGRWDNRDEGVDDEPSVSPAPFTSFPGLSPRIDEELPQVELATAMMNQAPGWLGLVAADRAADAPMNIGWFACSDAFALVRHWGRWESADIMTALLRSWEDRFGARPVRLGFASLDLLVARPPRTQDEALRVAGELWGIADEFGQNAVRSVRDIAQEVLGAPIWHFWWD